MALRLLTRPVRLRSTWIPRLAPYSTASRASDPLRILFCGSDEFSCFSLRALHEEHQRNADLIRSIDVLVRPSKPTGRGYKVLREVPLRTLADHLGLPVHMRDTFTGWDMPQPAGEPINLIIAVSFGLFVPARLLSQAKYGGLNVHPSLLPDLRGPAPLHHALLDRSRTHTGVTIQTLSPTAFDAGTILLQTPPPGVPLPLPAERTTVAALRDELGARGAAMLVEALRRGLHVGPVANPPSHHLPPHPPPAHPPSSVVVALRHAPKITSADRQVRWADAAGAEDVALRARVLGPLWAHLVMPRRRSRAGGGDGEVVEKRVILEDLSVVYEMGGDGQVGNEGGVVTWVLHESTKGKDAEGQRKEIKAEYRVDGHGVVVRMHDGSWLRIGKIKVEGSTSKPARQVLESITLGRADT